MVSWVVNELLSGEIIVIVIVIVIDLVGNVENVSSIIEFDMLVVLFIYIMIIVGDCVINVVEVG